MSHSNKKSPRGRRKEIKGRGVGGEKKKGEGTSNHLDLYKVP